MLCRGMVRFETLFKIFYTTILIINVTDSSHRMNEINQLKTQANLNEQTSKFSYDINVEFSTFVICKLLPVDLKYGAATSLIRILNTLQNKCKSQTEVLKLIKILFHQFQ